MKIIDIASKEQLNGFVSAQEHSQFLQSWEWGEFQGKVSGEVLRLGVEDKGKIIATMKAIKKDLPINKYYFYCGRGPVIDKSRHFSDEEIKEILNLLFGEVAKIAVEGGIMFLRFDPIPPILEDFLTSDSLRFPVEKTIDVQPSKTLILDLNKSEEEILAAMHQKTRYNIKLSEKKGVKAYEGSHKEFEKFWSLLDQTCGRDKFRPHGRFYYQEMLNLEKDFIKLFFAEYEANCLATGIFSFFGDTVTYLHGGSADDSRNVMAPYLLQWNSIKAAKSLGFKYYDFHGINEEKWPGVTRFKKGFGGTEINYPGTYDLIFDQSWYNIYKMMRKIRRTF